MPGSIENAVQLFRSAQSSRLLAEHFRRTEAVVVAEAQRLMGLGIVIGHEPLMRQFCSLPTRGTASHGSG